MFRCVKIMIRQGVIGRNSRCFITGKGEKIWSGDEKVNFVK